LQQRSQHRGFTLVELLVVIGIIVVLIGILLPVVSKIRRAALVTDTRNFVNQLGAAIERYQQDFKAYPGPFGNNDVCYASFTGGAFANNFLNKTPSGVGYDSADVVGVASITMSENLVLGLLGGIHVNASNSAELDYDATSVGGGPYSLSTIGLPKRYTAYLDNTKQLSWKPVGNNGIAGHFYDDSGAAADAIIPCFVDTFTDPMPILYMRAKIGANPAAPSGGYTNLVNPIVTNDLTETATPTVRPGQYDISQIIGYTGAYTGSWSPASSTSQTLVAGNAGTSIGIGKSAAASSYTTAPVGNNLYHGLQMATWTAPSYPSMTRGATGYQYPYDAYPYLTGSGGLARQKDSYILIAAGADRVYGTDDDICNFGTVGQ
jgi:prepilin-type N-terminal cleavage/methylation domain-containing protein